MAQATKGKLNYRCPRCFGRDLDLDMFYDEEKGEYFCIRCCFHGTEEEVLKLNEDFKGRYGRLKQRVESFGKDNQPPVFASHVPGNK